MVQSLSLKSIPKVLLSVVEKSLLLLSSNPFLTAEFPERKHKASKPFFSQSLKAAMPLQNKEREATYYHNDFDLRNLFLRLSSGW